MHLILHVGPPKTGSTSIQRALWRNGPALEASGCHHFRGAKPAEWALQVLHGGHGDHLPPVLRRHFDTVAEARDWSAACWRQFEAETAAARAPVTVVSSEHLANIRDHEVFLSRISRGFDRVTLVAYARDPVDLYVSELAELIRGGRRFADLPQLHRARYEAMSGLRRFEALLGADNIVIRRFDPRGPGPTDPVADFFGVVSARTGLTLPHPDPDVSPANPALCGAATAWLLTLNDVQDIQAETGPAFRAMARDRDRIVAALAAAPGLAALPRLTMTDPVLAHQLRWQADETLAWLNSTHLDVPLPRVPPPACDATPLSPGRLRARLRDWIMSHATSDAMQVLARVLTRRDRAPHGAGSGEDQSSRTCVPI